MLGLKLNHVSKRGPWSQWKKTLSLHSRNRHSLVGIWVPIINLRVKARLCSHKSHPVSRPHRRAMAYLCQHLGGPWPYHKFVRLCMNIDALTSFTKANDVTLQSSLYLRWKKKQEEQRGREVGKCVFISTGYTAKINIITRFSLVVYEKNIYKLRCVLLCKLPASICLFTWGILCS